MGQNMVDIDTKLFRSFLCVAAEQSFSTAARRLEYSQATMSLHIRALEEKLGVRLFHRSPHNVTLTAEGHRLLPEIRALVDMHDRMVGRLRSGPVYGQVRLGVEEACAVSLLPGLLNYAAEEHPSMDLDVRCQPSERLGQMVEARLLDLAVVFLQHEEPSALILAQPQLHWVASPDFQLDGEAPVPVAWGEKGSAFRAAGIAELSRHGVASREIFRSSDDQAVKVAVAAGVAVTVMAEGTIPDTLKAVLPRANLPPLGRAFIQLLERPGPHSEATEMVKRKIVDTYRESDIRIPLMADAI